MTARELTAANFESTIVENDIVFVDFWAGWCGPCQQFAPTYEATARAHPELVFGSVDTESEPSLAATFDVQSIPTLLAFRERVLVFAQAGALAPDGLEQLVEAVCALDMDDVHRQLAAQAREQDGEQAGG